MNLQELKHLSYSSVSLWLDCGRAWQFRYLDRAPSMASPALVVGSAWHTAVESLITGKAQDPVAAWNDAFAAQALRDGIAWGVDTPEDHRADGATLIANPTIYETIRSIRPYVDDRGPFVERFVSLSIPGVDIPVIGYIDVMTDDMIPCDLKTSGRAWSQQKAKAETQPLFYIAGLNQAGMKLDGRFRHYVFVKGAHPQVQVFDETHSLGEIFALFENIQTVWKGISGGVFPMRYDSWKCNPAYCDYWHLCRGKHE